MTILRELATGDRSHLSLLAEINPETGCWLWVRNTSIGGYANLTHNGKALYAHRLLWSLTHGEIPPGLQLDHKCRNRHCINPDHLEPVTNTENSRRKPATKLTAAQAEEIKRRGENESSYSLAREFGVSRMHAWRIVNGKRWSDIPSSPSSPAHTEGGAR